jgi:hypothetical protein
MEQLPPAAITTLQLPAAAPVGNGASARQLLAEQSD